MIKLNGIPINITLFPDGTTQVWHLDHNSLYSNYETPIVEWEYSHEAEFLYLAQLKALLDKYVNSVYLKISYLPYARQDKQISNETTFALEPFSKLLNSLSFQLVEILDPHSNNALKLINNSRAVYPIETVKKVFKLTSSDVIVFPDKGAFTKYENIYQKEHNQIISANKVRDQTTGKILHTKLLGDVNNKRVLIVDDICDGGMTFMELSRLLFNCGAKEVNLFVTHGLFTKGLKPMRDAGIKRFFTSKGEAYDYQFQVLFKELS